MPLWLPRTAAAYAGVLSMLLILLLSGCALQSTKTTVSYSDLMKRAASQALVGDREAAIAAYQRAARANPVKAQPWIELAQLYFRGDDYGHAIVAAREGLMRKPSSWRADSILTISGLRVAFDALVRLHNKVGINGTVREEARRLVELLRTTLGEQALVIGDDNAQSSISAAASEPAPHPVATQRIQKAATDRGQQSSARVSGSGNPFTVLKELSSN